MGYRYESVEAKKQGQNGACLGFDRFASLNLKLSQFNCPLLQDFNIEPFVYANFAVAENRDTEVKVEKKTWLKKHLRWATGIGMSFQPSGFSLECYYNVYVSKQKDELLNNF